MFTVLLTLLLMHYSPIPSDEVVCWAHCHIWIVPQVPYHPQSTCTSSTTTSSSASDEDFHSDTEGRESQSTTKRSKSAQLQQATPAAAAAAQAEGGTGLLPHLQLVGRLPRFVCCKNLFQASSVHLSHWVGSPLRAAAPGSKVPVEITLQVHPSGLDPDSYVRSRVSAATPTAPSPAAAAAGSSGQTGGQAEPATILGPYSISAHWDVKRCTIRATGLSSRDVKANYSGQVASCAAGAGGGLAL
jgi:hypothetical protein